MTRSQLLCSGGFTAIWSPSHMAYVCRWWRGVIGITPYQYDALEIIREAQARVLNPN